jgi:hypothetical protein
VPFTSVVNVGTANKSATWLTYAPWDAVGAGYGAYEDSRGSSCTAGSRGCNWIASDSHHSTWNGCVMDRNQNYDIQNTLPSAAAVATLFPAAPAAMASQTGWNMICPSQMIGQTDVLDSKGWSSLNGTVSAMQASGTTNQPIGLAWGWMLLTSGSPIVDPGPLPTNTKPIIILLSDGFNTQDRFSGDGSAHAAGVDTRMGFVCTNAKNSGVTIYTVFVDLGGTSGNSAVLSSCASDSSKYFHLTTANQIITAFNQIGDQITQLRVVQ